MSLPLDPVALAFVRSLEPTLKLPTCEAYRTTLRQFHWWLGDEDLTLESLQRPQLERWFQELNNRGLHPATRVMHLHRVRRYLRWLFERGGFKEHPEDLVRRGDFPKKPSYLPRPFPPDFDLELQRRLERSGNLLWRGLLLMRHTGLRVGELRALDYECIRVDPTGNRFLEVPLGKLNNERLVPISEKTYGLIRELQGEGARPREYLLERSPGMKTRYNDLREALLEASEGLNLRENPTTHQFRHTYATALLNGGMSLVGLMRLLGHHDSRMTLRYAAITQETVGREYFEALDRLSGKYGVKTSPSVSPCEELDPVKALTDVVAWVQKNMGQEKDKKRTVRSLYKRLFRIRAEIQSFIAR